MKNLDYYHSQKMNSKVSTFIGIILILLFFTSSQVKSQNTWASVQAVAGSVVTLNAGHAGNFIVGEQALIIQMKGATIVETNSPAYGGVTGYNGAGTFAFANVLAVNGDDITLDIGVDAYNVAANVQLVSVPGDGAGDYVEDGTNLPMEWDGHKGGVYAINICGTYTLTGDLGIAASAGGGGGGFRGGLSNGVGDYYGALEQQFVALDLNDFDFGAFKGEGIASTYCTMTDLGEGVPIDVLTGTSSGGWAYNYAVINMGKPGVLCSEHDIGSGPIANGGGSGTMVDGGGGGGGNGGVGGVGGCGWNINYVNLCAMGKACGDCVKEDVQGFGGLATGGTGLTVHLGGGGGSGWTDKEVSGDDGMGKPYFGGQGFDGGMIFIINATNVDGNNNTIYADAEDAYYESSWQANGGGGAGGTILVNATNANNLNLSAVGGEGGTAYFEEYGCYADDGELGPGGGGGGGIIIAPASGNYVVDGGISGVYYDTGGKARYGSKANGTPWCAEDGNDGIVVTPPPPGPTCVITLDAGISCAGNDGALEVKVYLPLCASGEPMDVVWSGSGNTDNNLMIGDSSLESNLGADTYTVTVNDDNGGQGTCEYVLPPAVALVAIILDSTNVTCPGDSDGEIVAGEINGSAPFTYAWSSGGATDQATNTALTANPLPGGTTYTVTVTDAGGCTSSTETYIYEPDPIIINIDNTVNETACGDDDGRIEMSWISGGVYQDVITSVVFDYDIADGDVIKSGMGMGQVEDNNFDIVVAGINPANIDLTTILEVCIDIDPEAEEDEKIEIYLVGPDGDEFGLKYQTMGMGETFVDVCFNMSAADVLADGASPYTGSWLPDQFGFDDPANPIIGGAANGTWSLWVGNGANMNDGVLNSWSLSLNNLVPGVGPPAYVWDGPAPFSSTSEDPTALVAGVYTVTATDENGCTVSAETTLTCPIPPTCSIGIDQEPICNLDCNGKATVTILGGSSPNFAIDWGVEFGTITAIGLAHQAVALCDGLYEVTVTDAIGLTGICQIDMTEPPPVTTAISNFNNPLCNGSLDGDIEVTYGGGTPSYQVSWSTPNTYNTQPVGTHTEGNLGAGDYIVTVTDANGCSLSAEQALLEPTVVTVTADGVDPSCFGFSDGDVTSVATGGAAGYNYAWTGTANQQNNFGTVGSGMYTVTATDINGCTGSDEFELFGPALLTVSISGQTDPLCNNGTDGIMAADGVGGTIAADYQYRWSGAFQTTQTVSNLLGAVTYTITITDDNSCTATAEGILVNPELVAAGSESTPVVCGQANGTAWVDTSIAPISGGVAPYDILWDATAGGGTNSLATGLAAGNYPVTITDANACTLELIVNVSDPAAAIVNWNNTSDIVACNGGNDAFGEIEIVSGAGNFQIRWSGGTAVGGITDVTTGFYSATDLSAADSPLGVTVTDANGCETPLNLPISEPTVIVVSPLVINPECYGVASFGTLQATASGGTQSGSYDYLWDNNVGTEQDNIGDVDVAGTVDYLVTATDDNGCTGTATAQLVEPNEVASSITGIPPSCNGLCDGSVDLATPTGGNNTSYSFIWSPDGEITEDLVNKCDGTYEVTIADDNGCTITQIITLTEPSVVIATANTTGHATCDATCFNGDVIGAGSGGTVAGDYSYEWDDPSITTTAAATGLNNNIYCVAVTDDNMCSDIACTEVLGYPGQTWVPELIHILCYGDATGSIDLSLTIRGNGPPYVFVWDPAVTTPSAADSIRTNLIAGTYSVTITDALGEVFIRSYVLTEPASPLGVQCSGVDPLCYEYTDGSVAVVASGGTSGYIYLWDDANASTGANVGDIGAGTYNVIVTDANGCIETCLHVLTDPAELTVTLIDNKPSDCGVANGELTANAAGGTGAYSYEWDPTDNDDVVSPNNLSNGTNTVTVTDDNGCTASAEDDLIDPNSPVVTVTVIKNVSCFGGSDGEVEVEITGGAEPYDYEWTVASGTTPGSLANAGTLTLTGIAAEMVSVTVTDFVQCGSGNNDTVTEPELLVSNATDGSILCYEDETAKLYTTTTGGTSPYTYLWDNAAAATAGTVFNQGGGTYTVIVTDDNDCSTTSYAVVDPLTPIVVTLNHDTVTCYEACDGILYVSASGGASSSYSYEWFFPNRDSLTTPSVFNGICGNNENDSTYWVIVKDNNGCIADTVYEAVERPDSIRARIQLIGDLTSFSPLEVTFVDSSHLDYYNTSTWYVDNAVELNDEDTLSMIFENNRTTSYLIELEVSRDGDCIDQASVNVVVEAGSFFAIPDVFTPNGDDYNDKFMVSYINICTLDGQIFNRWGEKLFEWNGVETGWDGRTLSGEEVPDGVYYYLIDAIGCDGQEYLANKGHVTIIR
ncbi:MAG: gliding motility-associated C-terminal domain-containing protein [Flavobacteriales bacterium]|nr:gliding motility-associated C-terminal domain-containing protein [Flavobacteriales bacterium]